MRKTALFAWIGAAGAAAALIATVSAATAGSRKLAEVKHPRDATLVVIPAGEVTIGDNEGMPDERPAIARHFSTFVMDRTPVTVSQFATFVRETGYVTDAERAGEAGVLDRGSLDWTLVRGANWRLPKGPGTPAAEPDHPVTQVSWRDADAFCRAYGARLPTEFEWERAARMGQTPDGHVFKTGDPLRLNGKYLANVWQGFFPLEDTGEDGYRTTSPVGAFGETPAGLTDMAGNVWEWTASPHLPYGAASTPQRDGQVRRVQRGGSFLCDPSFCAGFRVTARNPATPETALMHVGFRCAVDAGRATAFTGRLRAPQA